MFVKSKDNVKIYYKKIKGKKPTIVFIHGLAGSCESFKNQSRILRNSQLLIDLRGHGKSGKPLGKDHYTPGKMIDDIKEVIKKEKLRNYVLIGFSLGGYLSMQIKHKGKTILINPAFGKSSLKKSFLLKLWISRYVPKWFLKLFVKSYDLSIYKGLLDLYAKLLLRTPFHISWSIVQNLKEIKPVKKPIIIKSTNDEIVKGKGDYYVKGHHYILSENYNDINKILLEQLH